VGGGGGKTKSKKIKEGKKPKGKENCGSAESEDATVRKDRGEGGSNCRAGRREFTLPRPRRTKGGRPRKRKKLKEFKTSTRAGPTQIKPTKKKETPRAAEEKAAEYL